MAPDIGLAVQIPWHDSNNSSVKRAMAEQFPHSPPSALVLFAHPKSHLSRVNRQLAEAASALPHVTVHDLYEQYPDFYIDVPAEQARLAAAQVIVFLHPIQWYSMPSLMKEWVDSVLVSGWAYGEHGHALAGKTYFLAVTAGSKETAYAPGAVHGRSLDEFLHAFRQTAALCEMQWVEPHVLYGAHLVDDDIVAQHVHAFVTRLSALLQPSLSEPSHGA